MSSTRQRAACEIALVLPAGLLWVCLHRRFPNVWALGITHGIIGTCVYYFVLGCEPFLKLFS